jgi:periplasmic protein CpxP/Spy
MAALLASPIAMPAAVPQNQGGGQEGGHGQRMTPEDRLKDLTKQLSLTDDQQAKIKPILEDQQKKMDDLRNNSSGDRQERGQKMQQIRKDTNDQIRAVLDDNQKTKFDKMEQEREDRMKHHGSGPGPGTQS